MQPPVKLGVAIPCHALGNIATSALLAIQRSPLVEENFPFVQMIGSALTMNHNRCWAWALNEHRAGRISHFLLMHSDIEPQMQHWIEVLIEEMERNEADVLGCFIAIKNPQGLTSTAIDTDPWRPRRISLREAKQLPVTWTAPNLLLNTGLLLFHLDSFAYGGIPCFRVTDKIERDASGNFAAYHQPEDWNFSRQCHALEKRLYVTRGIRVAHAGIAVYPNAPAWGQETDKDCVRGSDEWLLMDQQEGPQLREMN